LLSNITTLQFWFSILCFVDGKSVFLNNYFSFHKFKGLFINNLSIHCYLYPFLSCSNESSYFAINSYDILFFHFLGSWILRISIRIPLLYGVNVKFKQVRSLWWKDVKQCVKLCKIFAMFEKSRVNVNV